MTINYRSHKKIIDSYNKFMKSWDWNSNIKGVNYRYDKEIRPDSTGVFPEYPAVFSIWGKNDEDEGGRFADFVHFLKENNIIEDYKVIKKVKVDIPDTLINIVKCQNPNCVTNHEEIKTKFVLINKQPLKLMCHYCERAVNSSEIMLK